MTALERLAGAVTRVVLWPVLWWLDRAMDKAWGDE